MYCNDLYKDMNRRDADLDDLFLGPSHLNSMSMSMHDIEEKKTPVKKHKKTHAL